jgi:hypothetical protein
MESVWDERIWRREGLKVPQKQKPRGRLWLKDGSCVRRRPGRRTHVWSYDFVSARTHDGRSVRLLNLINEHMRELAVACGTPLVQRQAHLCAGRCDGEEESAGTPSLGQWA